MDSSPIDMNDEVPSRFLFDYASCPVTQHLITIQKGEDIIEPILKFAISIPQFVCVLSANGKISYAEINSFGWSLTYCNEELYDLVQIHGGIFHMNPEFGRVGGKLNVIFRDPLGNNISGKVSGPVVAAETIHIVLLSWRKESLEDLQPKEMKKE